MSEQQKDNPYHKTYFHRYNKWSEFVDALNNAKKNHNPNASDSSQSDERASSIPWSGTHTFEEALKHLNEGWQWGLDRIKDIRTTIPPDLFDCIMPIVDYKPEMQHKIAGGTLDVGQFITGATPENFITEVIPHDATENPKQQGKKLITIYIQLYNSCHCDWDAFLYRGSYAFAMIEHLENCGYSVELWSVFYNRISRHGEEHQRIYVKTKEFGELFDANKLAVTLCSPFFLRRFIFALQETYDDTEVWITNHAYGNPPTKNGIEQVVLDDDMDLSPLWISYINIGTAEETLKQYRKLLDDYISGDVLQE